MIDVLVRLVTYPLWERLNGYSDRALLRELRATERRDAGAIRALQRERLRAILVHAYATVPFYRERFDAAGFHPESARLPEEIARLPLLDKATINANLDRLISTAYRQRPLERDTTSGSTGRPLRFVHDRIKRSSIRAVTLRENAWLGCRLGDKTARLWGGKTGGGGPPAVMAWLDLHLLRRTLRLDAFDFDDGKIARFLDEIARFRPKLIISYASAAYFVARYAERHGLRPVGPEFFVTTAETLHDEQRDTIERVFRTRVVNRYALREIGQVASGCALAPGMHVNEDCVFLEIEPLAGATEERAFGRIVLTDMTSFAMPLIRYDTEDLGTLDDSPCACALPFRKLTSVAGRVSDMLSTRSGRSLHGAFFGQLLREVRGVERFQVVQEALDRIALRVVRSETFDEQKMARVVTEIREAFGPAADVRLEFVPAIDTGGSGKHRFTISKVPRD